MSKSHETYKEKYKKGTTVDTNSVLKILNENKDKLVIELRERSIYSDDSLSMLIHVKINK